MNSKFPNSNKLKLTGMMKPIKDNHTRKDDFALVTNPSSANVTDDHEIAIQYLQ